MTVKPEKRFDNKEVIYSSERWAFLREYREKAIQIIDALESFRLQTLTHGSIARGDVNKKSDIDIFIPEPQSSFLVETALEKAEIPVDAIDRLEKLDQVVDINEHDHQVLFM